MYLRCIVLGNYAFAGIFNFRGFNFHVGGAVWWWVAAENNDVFHVNLLFIKNCASRERFPRLKNVMPKSPITPKTGTQNQERCQNVILKNTTHTIWIRVFWTQTLSCFSLCLACEILTYIFCTTTIRENFHSTNFSSFLITFFCMMFNECCEKETIETDTHTQVVYVVCNIILSRIFLRWFFLFRSRSIDSFSTDKQATTEKQLAVCPWLVSLPGFIAS